ncbi:hypothetical protein BDV19DRAFT_167584 [Aspergillus venezuelensis]
MLANTSAPGNAPRVNPYETNLDLIPEDDPFRQRSIHYGRYLPQPDDFTPKYSGWYNHDPDVQAYWEETVQSLWTPENSLRVDGTRQAYAAGSILIRVDEEDATGAAAQKFSLLNANELGASKRAEETLEELQVAVPKILFYGTISGKNVTVESRLPGVSLDVAWRHLSTQQIELMKQQCRIVSDRISNDPGPGHPSYVCSELNSHSSSTGEMEHNILFGENEARGNFPLVHNNMLLHNIVVNNHRIVGLIGWREAGYFGFGKTDKVHRQVRVPKLISEAESGVGLQNLITWADLYDGLPGVAPHQPTPPAPSVKVEPSAPNLEGVPLSTETDAATEEHPTPKKIASLKNREASRASSSDRSSPAGSIKPPAKRAAPGTKKGIGRKTSTKKRKTDNDNESIDSRRSATPSSSRASKASGVRKQSSASLANSPAPELKKKGGKKAKAEVDEDEEEEGEEDTDDGEVFCICRRPDNHTWMIGCDGGCEDWFHGKCVNIDPRDAELIERYICPNCKERGKGWTTWKPMCRLVECRKPARFTGPNPSKYCSDEHGLEFMRQKCGLPSPNLSTQAGSQRPKSMLRTALNGSRTHTPTPVDDDSEYDSHIEDEQDTGMEDLGSRGGVLTLGDLAAVIMAVGSAEEFRELGSHIVSPPPSPPPETEEEEKEGEVKEEDPDSPSESQPKGNKLGLDVSVPGLTYSPDEESRLDQLRQHRSDLFHRREMLAARNTFLSLVRQRSKSILDTLKKKDPKGGWKDICGFDSRFAWSDEEFDEWRLSEQGKNALESGNPDALAASYPKSDDSVDADGDTAMDGDEDSIEALTRGVCTKKRCERHKQWVKVQQQDIAFEERTLADDLVECEKEAKGVVERAVLRMWAEDGDANANALASGTGNANGIVQNGS